MSFFVTKLDDGYGGFIYQPTTAGFTALVIILLAILLLGVCIFGKNKKFSAKQLAFSAMAIALATATSYLKLFHLPMGGSVTLLSMLFIVLVGYWFGLGAGLTAAIAYGILQLVLDPYIISVPQMIVDYILAFGALGIGGLFHKNKSKYALIYAYVTGVLGRYFFAFLSGWIFFGMYAGDYGFKTGVGYSLAYNGAYLGAEAAITIIILCIPPVRTALHRVKELATS